VELIRGLNRLGSRQEGCVVTIGNFDGVHRGHQTVLRQLQDIATKRALPKLVITFEPHAQEYFRPDKAPPRLTRWREKFELLRAHGIDQMVCLRFDEHLAALPARAFIEQVLVAGLKAACLVVGDDFRFGRGREGDYALLEAMATVYGFEVVRAETYTQNGERVSSTAVRRALGAGDLERARQLLGRYYSISGRIGHGDKRGRALGFATANIDLHRRQSPLRGIFVARVFGIANTGLPAVAYIGSHSCMKGTRNPLEVHIFDFARECYGIRVRVEFIKKLRDDKYFDSIEALKHQIAADAERARAILGLKSLPLF
jgi:riboflavin kinase / FMN adenylyltransferase